MATKKSATKTRRPSRGSRTQQPPEQPPSAARGDLPYVLSNNRIPELFSRLQSAAVPSRVSVDFLRKLGFTSSNDRAFPSLLRRLGFLDASGAPTERYRAYRNPVQSRAVLGEGIYEAYHDLYAVNERLHHLDPTQVRGIVSQVTGHGAENSRRIAGTFLALADLADIPEPGVVTVPGPSPTADDAEAGSPHPPAPTPSTAPPVPPTPAIAPPGIAGLNFRHNLEIHLPATTDISVYNAIFKSIREHLLS
jgi:hypothetical protein